MRTKKGAREVVQTSSELIVELLPIQAMKGIIAAILEGEGRLVPGVDVIRVYSSLTVIAMTVQRIRMHIVQICQDRTC